MATWELYEILTVFSTLVMLAAVATYAVEKPLQQWLTTVLTVEEPELPGHVKCCGSCHIEPVDSSWRSGSTKFDDEESSDFVHTGSCGQAICCGCSGPRSAVEESDVVLLREADLVIAEDHEHVLWHREPRALAVDAHDGACALAVGARLAEHEHAGGQPKLAACGGHGVCTAYERAARHAAHVIAIRSEQSRAEAWVGV